MDKLDRINENVTGFFKDIVSFIEKVWEYFKKFFAEDAEKPLVDEETT